MGIHKRFSPELHTANDARAVSAVLSWIGSEGGYAVQNDDLYGPDIVLFRGIVPHSYIEVEIKHNWKSGPFPFPTVHLPERKGKYLRKKMAIEYWILRTDLECAMIIPDYELSSSLLEEVPNKLISSGELFYKIPVDRCIHKELNND